MNAFERYFHVVLFISLHKVILTSRELVSVLICCYLFSILSNDITVFMKRLDNDRLKKKRTYYRVR